MLRAAGVRFPEARGLAIWSVLSGAALIVFLFAFFRALGGRPSPAASARLDEAGEWRALWATVVTACAPLFWFTALRPLSDMTGLAAAVAAQALVVSAIARRGASRTLILGAFVAGLAVGVRSQTLLLTAPLLGLALVMPKLGLRLKDRVAAFGAAIIGALVWAIPMIAASGGLVSYAGALGTQAGEDFSGVVMLWRVHTARAVLDAVLQLVSLAVGASRRRRHRRGDCGDRLRAAGVVDAAHAGPAPGGVRAVRDLPSVVPGDGDRALRAAARDSGGLSRRERAGVAGQRSPSRRRRCARGLVSDRHPARDGDLRTQREPRVSCPGRGGRRRRRRSGAAGAGHRHSRRSAARRRVDGGGASRARADGAARAGVADARRALEIEPAFGRLVRRRSAADGSRALRSGGQIGAAAVPVGVRRAALRRRRASGQFRRLRHASARLDAGPRMGADGRSRRRHRARRPRTPPEAERRVDPEPQRRSAADDRRPPPWSGHGSRRPHRPDA